MLIHKTTTGAQVNAMKAPLAIHPLLWSKPLTRLCISSYLHPIFEACMFGVSAIKKFLARFRVKAPAIAAFILLLLCHLSPSLVIAILLPYFRRKRLVHHYITSFRYRTEYRDRWSRQSSPKTAITLKNRGFGCHCEPFASCHSKPKAKNLALRTGSATEGSHPG